MSSPQQKVSKTVIRNWNSLTDILLYFYSFPGNNMYIPVDFDMLFKSVSDL